MTEWRALDRLLPLAALAASSCSWFCPSTDDASSEPGLSAEVATAVEQCIDEVYETCPEPSEPTIEDYREPSDGGHVYQLDRFRDDTILHRRYDPYRCRERELGRCLMTVLELDAERPPEPEVRLGNVLFEATIDARARVNLSELKRRIQDLFEAHGERVDYVDLNGRELIMTTLPRYDGDAQTYYKVAVDRGLCFTTATKHDPRCKFSATALRFVAGERTPDDELAQAILAIIDRYLMEALDPSMRDPLPACYGYEDHHAGEKLVPEIAGGLCCTIIYETDSTRARQRCDGAVDCARVKCMNANSLVASLSCMLDCAVQATDSE